MFNLDCYIFKQISVIFYRLLAVVLLNWNQWFFIDTYLSVFELCNKKISTKKNIFSLSPKTPTYLSWIKHFYKSFRSVSLKAEI